VKEMKENRFKKILDYDIAIILIFVFIFFTGVFFLFSMKVTLLPRHTEPVLTIITDYYGMEPDIIEEIITKPIENILKEIEGIKDFYSYSYKGRSKILVYLERGEDIDRKAIFIKDRIYHISERFPPEVREPAVYKYNTEDRPVMILSLSAQKGTTGELFSFVEKKVKPELLSIDGIANVEIAGSSIKEYIIEQPYENLARLKGNAELVFREIVKNNVLIPVGNLKDENNLITLTFPNKYTDLFSLPEQKFDYGGSLISGADLFTVKKQERASDKASFINNEEGLTLYVYKKSFSNILEIERGVKRVIDKRGNAFSCRPIFNQAERFKALLKQLEIGLAVSVGCVFFIIFIFYRNVLFSLLILFTIPLSAAGTLTFFGLFSRSLNVMTLAGLIAGIGMCVDSTIIITESARDTMRNRSLLNSLPSTMRRVHPPLLASTLTTIIVFLPMFYMDSRTASLYSDFALSVSLMLIFSYLVSLFFIPSLIKRVYAGKPVQNYETYRKRMVMKPAKKKKGLKKLSSFFLFMVNKIADHPVISLGAFLIITGFFSFLFITLEYEEISVVKAHEYELYYEFDPGFHSSYKKKVMYEIGSDILHMELPCTLVSKLDGSRATFLLQFPAGCRGYKVGVQKIKDYFSEKFRSDGFFYFQKGRESGIKAATVYFFGDNIEQLNQEVDKVSAHLAGLYGIRQVLKGYREGTPEIELLIDQGRLSFYNRNVSEVIRFLRYIFHSPVIMKFYDGETILDVRGKVGVDHLKKENILSIGIPGGIPGKDGDFITLGDFASVVFHQGSGTASRKNGKRYIPLSIYYEHMKENTLIQYIQSSIDKTGFERDFYYEFDESLLEARKNRISFIFTLCLALYLVFTILGVILKSFSKPAVIILTMPSVFVGSVLFLWISGFGRSIPAQIALIMILGLSVNNLILLMGEVSRLQHRRKRTALLLGYRRKMRLVFLTTFTTVISLLPVFLLSTATSFFKILTGVTAVGMLSSLFISLGMYPALYTLIRASKR